MLKTRLITSAVGLVVLGLVMALFHTPVFELVVSVITIIALDEIYKAIKLESGKGMIFAGLVPYVFAVMYSNLLGIEEYLLVITFVLLLYMACCLVRHSQTLDFNKLSGLLGFGAMVITCFYSMVWLKSMMPHTNAGNDALYVIFLILGFAWGGDSAAYFAGRFFGKHKLAPIVSPHKTVEGAIGGVLGSVLVGILITAVYGMLAKEQAMGGLTTQHYLVISVLGAIASVLGILGDLFASVVKRQCGIKDYGYIFPGHGGILDRFDSVLFIAPVVALGITFTLHV